MRQLTTTATGDVDGDVRLAVLRVATWHRDDPGFNSGN